MSNVHTPISTTVRVRMPVEFLAFLDNWSASRGLPRSVAIRHLMFKGLAQSADTASVDELPEWHNNENPTADLIAAE